MPDVKLSYITSTKNKLPYLKAGLEKLIAHKKSDEEILIADGGSTDGTKDYLAELKKEGKIDYFVSEPDFGESHALNKLFLKARGELVSIITDDDVYYYPTVEENRKFMLSNPEIDVLGTEGGSFNKTFSPSKEADPYQLIRALNYENDYRKWLVDKTPYSFCGLGLMIRRSSLPIVGLWNLSFLSADAEFSFRMTASKANIAWNTGYSFVNIKNLQSTTWLKMEDIKRETERLNKFYLDKNPESFIVQKIKVFGVRIKNSSSSPTKESAQNFRERWPDMVAMAETWLSAKNKGRKSEFIRNK